MLKTTYVFLHCIHEKFLNKYTSACIRYGLTLERDEDINDEEASYEITGSRKDLDHFQKWLWKKKKPKYMDYAVRRIECSECGADLTDGGSVTVHYSKRGCYTVKGELKEGRGYERDEVASCSSCGVDLV